MKKVAMITGATSGIGIATARLFAQTKEFDLIITGRRAERLKELKQELREKYDTAVHVLCFDVRDYQRGRAALEALPEEFRRIDVLVNNAGRATDLVKFQDVDVRNWDARIDLNVKGFIYMARLISELMVSPGGGTILTLHPLAATTTYDAGHAPHTTPTTTPS